jgi:AraC-like DNA-binding protein
MTSPSQQSGRELLKRPYPKGRRMPKEWRFGERNAARKIGWLEAAEIRLAPGGYGKTKELAIRFGISRTHVRRIRAGLYWNFGERRAPPTGRRFK